MMKKVGIDFHVVDSLFQGSRTHVLELFGELIKQSPDIHFVLFLQNTEFLFSYSDAFRQSNVELINMPYVNPVTRLVWQLPRLCRRHAIDLLHTQYILPIPCPCRAVTTIHDILFETHPQYFTRPFRLRSSTLMRWSAYRSQHIFTVSEFTKAAMGKIYKIPEDRVTVIHNGVDNLKFYPGNDGLHHVISRGLESDGYILSVGRLEPRKNHVSLLRAFAKLQNKKLPLVLVGQPHFGFDEVFSVIDELGLKDRVLILKDVADMELPSLYRHARLFAYPTWAEGFGMPPIEAMASGAPVVSSRSTSIPEVVGDAALLVDPSDVDEIAEAIDRVLGDVELSNTLRKRGVEQAKLFNWRVSAGKVREIYLSTLRSS